MSLPASSPAPAAFRGLARRGAGPAHRLSPLALVAALALLPRCAPSRGTVGAVLGRGADERVLVREAPPALGAAQAGLRPGDEILLIAGEEARGLSDSALRERLRGAPGTTVRLTVVRDGRVLHITVTRTEPPPKPASPPSATP